MDGQDVLFVLLGVKWTLPLIVTAIGGFLTGLLALYKLIERWRTREKRRLDMLREYVDKEEKDITARRKNVFDSIRMSRHSFLSDKKFDVGAEIDQAIQFLDHGYPERAIAKLSELEKRLEANEAILRRRADDLKRHTASVHIFLAALADRSNNPQLGLVYIDKAIDYDQFDPDALKYKALLLLNRGDLDGAKQSYHRLRLNANGPENAGYRADAHLGLAATNFKRGPEHFEDAIRSLATALQNMNNVPTSVQDHYTFAQIYQLQGLMYKAPDWTGTDREKALESYRKALNSLNQIPNKRETVESDIRDVESAIGQLQLPN